MGYINNLSMRGKLVTLVLPALLVILFFAASAIRQDAGELRNMKQMQAMVQLAEAGDPLVEALQKERGRSAVLLASDPGSSAARQAGSALDAQRQDTDRNLQAYRADVRVLLTANGIDGDLKASVERLDRQLERLATLRRNVTSQAVNGQEAGRLYTAMIMEVINRIPTMVRRSSEPGLTRQITAYLALAEAAEMAGRERAAGASLIRAGEFDLAAVGRITALEGQQTANFGNSVALLPEGSELRTRLENFPSTTANRDLQTQRTTLMDSPIGLKALEPGDWFDASTRRIEAINGIRTGMLNQVGTMAAAGVASARNQLIVASVIAAGAMVAVILLMAIIIHSIHRQVSILLEGVEYAISNKDLTREIPVSSNDETGTIARAINTLLGRFGDALGQIDRASVQLAAATEQTRSTANQNTTQVKDQQQQIEQIAAASEEMSATCEEISNNTQRVAGASTRAMDKSRTGEQVLHANVSQIRDLAGSVQEVNQVIEELEKRSENISDVVDVIRKVADQTNLLALNAAIEAARAGEHGRGFAVVADEVRTLAQQTHQSTTQIEEIINGFRDITDSASRSITASHRMADHASTQAAEMEQTFAEILADVNSISDMATQIATASEQQVSVTRELAGNMERVSESAILTLTGSQEITQVTTEQARLARELKDLANEFRLVS